MADTTRETRRRLSPGERRKELLALGAEVFGQRPYDEVRIDEIAERAGVSRALMYHYFPDKRAFFAEVVRTEGERLFDATTTSTQSGTTLFQRLRIGVLAYVEYHDTHPQGSWAAYLGLGRSDPVLIGIDDRDNDRQMERIMARVLELAPGLDAKVERDLQAVVFGWLAFTLEMCKQRMIDPSLDSGYVADICAHALLDTVARIPAIPEELLEAVTVR